jgi:hypothetical protein
VDFGRVRTELITDMIEWRQFREKVGVSKTNSVARGEDYC